VVLLLLTERELAEQLGSVAAGEQGQEDAKGSKWRRRRKRAQSRMCS
jgi:hypothetical protein